jgi:hypothetical protein
MKDKGRRRKKRNTATTAKFLRKKREREPWQPLPSERGPQQPLPSLMERERACHKLYLECIAVSCLIAGI